MPGLFSQIRRKWRAQSARRDLETLSDRQLQDIGIRRDQIAAVVRCMPERH